MSTRSSITVKCEDGKFRSVYCHFDGDLIWVGKVLFKYYNSQEKIEALVALGDMSSLDKSIKCPKGHSYDNSIDGYTIFYGRDRGESNVDALVEDSYAKCLKKNKQSYNYLWDGEKWLVSSSIIKKGTILEEKLIIEEVINKK